MKIYQAAWLVGMWLLWVPAMGQTTPAPGKPATTLAPSHQQAAEMLLSTIYSEASFNQMIDQRLTAQFKATPAMQQYEPEFRAFFSKYFSWASLRPELIAMYAQEFTELELREITRFYQSPTGQKAIVRVPILRQMALDIGQRRMQEHLSEFKEMITKKASAIGQPATDD